MSSNPPTGSSLRPDKINNSDEMRRLLIMWGVCCMSPVMYLAASAAIRSYLMDGPGYWPMQPYIWTRVLIGLGVWIVGLQLIHLRVKHLYKKTLAKAEDDFKLFMDVLARRTLLLILISELAVFAGFCLFLIQGDIKPVFASGVAAMFLYAQSHPRSGF